MMFIQQQSFYFCVQLEVKIHVGKLGLRRRTLILHIIFTVDELNAGKGLDCTRESNRRRDEQQQHQLCVHLTL
uniref:Uncharacterized protein n=1 Tax=Trichogramma kaykai TaxID=54128 RepID=A0ABD2WPB4_9HYME